MKFVKLGKFIINVDEIRDIELRNKIVFAWLKGTNDHARGEYETDKEAEKVFNELTEILLNLE